jgi:hypothetical protein
MHALGSCGAKPVTKLTIGFISDSTPRIKTEVESVIRQTLASHPFFGSRVRPPASLKVDVIADMSVQTSIEHHHFREDGRVKLNLNELQLYKTHLGGGPVCFDSDPLNAQLANLVAHEFGHFIDARLDSAFMFDDGLQPADNPTWRIFYNLWDSYIDGRLGPLAPYSLVERQEESWQVGRVPPELVERAWNGSFRTHGELVEAAVGLQSKSADAK